MNDGVQKMRNLRSWIQFQHFRQSTALVPTTEVLKQQMVKEFAKTLRQRLSETQNGSSVRYLPERIIKAATDQEISLTDLQANMLVNLFEKEGLTHEILGDAPIARSLYIVMADVSLTGGQTMGQFLDEVFEDTPMIEMACSILGDHDCVFTIWASSEELEQWVWSELRVRGDVDVHRTMTYLATSKVRHRFEVTKHIDYIKVQNQRIQKRAEASTSASKTALV